MVQRVLGCKVSRPTPITSLYERFKGLVSAPYSNESECPAVAPPRVSASGQYSTHDGHRKCCLPLTRHVAPPASSKQVWHVKIRAASFEVSQASGLRVTEQNPTIPERILSRTALHTQLRLFAHLFRHEKGKLLSYGSHASH